MNLTPWLRSYKTFTTGIPVRRGVTVVCVLHPRETSSKRNFTTGMTLGKKEAVDRYFERNYMSLLRYARKIVTDRNRTYDAEEIVNEAYLALMAKEYLILDKIDQYCKAWIKNTIVLDRSFANLNMCLKTDMTEDNALGVMVDQSDLIDEAEVEIVLEHMPKRRADIIKMLIEHETVKECCTHSGMNKRKMWNEIKLARASYMLTRKRLINK